MERDAFYFSCLPVHKLFSSPTFSSFISFCLWFNWSLLQARLNIFLWVYNYRGNQKQHLKEPDAETSLAGLQVANKTVFCANLGQKLHSKGSNTKT